MGFPTVALAHGGDFVRLGFLIAIAFHTLIFMLSLAVLDWKFALSYMATTVATFVSFIAITVFVFGSIKINLPFYILEFFVLLVVPPVLSIVIYRRVKKMTHIHASRFPYRRPKP
jgi:hypothetical protein